jgi:hypothetical protein
LSPGWSLRFTAMKTLTIFITPGGRSSPRRTFSTLSSKRAVRARASWNLVLLVQRLDLALLLVFEGEAATTGRGQRRAVPR